MEWQRWLVNQPVWTPVQQCAVRIQHRDAGRPQTNENANRASRNFRFPFSVITMEDELKVRYLSRLYSYLSHVMP